MSTREPDINGAGGTPADEGVPPPEAAPADPGPQAEEPRQAAPAGGPEPAGTPDDAGAEGPADAGASELEAVTAQRDEYLDALQRLKAEFDNYRRRAERERQALALSGARELARGLLPVLDNLERAIAAIGDQDEAIVAGVEMVRGQLAGVLASNGVEEIPAQEEFDPAVHEAVAQIPVPGQPAGRIVEVVEKGYTHGEIVLRPTKVVVASEPPQ